MLITIAPQITLQPGNPSRSMKSEIFIASRNMCSTLSASESQVWKLITYNCVCSLQYVTSNSYYAKLYCYPKIQNSLEI